MASRNTCLLPGLPTPKAKHLAECGREIGGNVSVVFIRSGQNSYWMFDKKLQALHFLFWERECAPLSFVCDDAVLQGGRLWWFKVKNITAYTFLKNCHHQKKVFAIGIQQIVERKKLSRGFFLAHKNVLTVHAVIFTFASFSLSTFNANFELFLQKKARCLLWMRRWQGREVGQKSGSMACKVAAV